jgi:arsenite methyltransferase
MADNSHCGCTPAGDSAGQVRDLYTRLALHPERDFGWGKGRQNARHLGYDPAWLERLPASIWESAAAVENPFSLGPLLTGETALDLGCGAGADMCIAALLVGATGRISGVDVTPAMVLKARHNAQLAGFGNVTVHEADMTALPLPDASVDVVISNWAVSLGVEPARGNRLP